MRIRRRIVVPFSFGMQTLLGLVGISALFMWWGAFFVLIAIATIAAHYCVLSVASILCARFSGMPDSPRFCKWQFAIPDDGTTIRAVVTGYLVFHYVGGTFWILVLQPSGFPAIWHSPSLGPLTAASIHHLCLVAFSLLLVTFFLFRAYAGARFSPRICVETSTLLSFLLVSHLTVP